MSDKVPEIAGVLETALYYTDEAATERFYTDIMRMRPIGKRPGYFLFYRAGRSVFLLFNPEASRRGETLPPAGADGEGHVCFLVDHAAYEPWKAYLESWQVDILQEVRWPRDAEPGEERGMSFYFRDPNGNLLEIANADFWPNSSVP
jgi:catechol 2,3-dioxygenase-like lactoylglutathione lyase family enzyme